MTSFLHLVTSDQAVESALRSTSRRRRHRSRTRTEEGTDIGPTSVSPRARGRACASFGAIKRSKLVTAFLESFEIVCGLVAKISKGPSASLPLRTFLKLAVLRRCQTQQGVKIDIHLPFDQPPSLEHACFKTYHHFRMLGWNFPQHTFIRYGALNTVEQLSRSAARVRSFASRHYGDHQNPILKGVARVASAFVLPFKSQRGGAIFHPRRIAVTKPEARLHSAPLQSV